MKKTAFIFLLLSITYLLPAQVQLIKDESFGINGKFTTQRPWHIENQWYSVESIVRGWEHSPSLYKTHDNNLFILFCLNKQNPDDDFFLLKITPQGVLDNSFGVNGKITIPMPSSMNATIHIENHKDTGFLIYSVNSINPYNKSILKRYNNNGIIDTTFGDNGTVIIPEGSANLSSQMKPFTISADNSILFYGGNNTIKKYNEMGVLVDETPYTGETGEIPFALKNNYFYWLSNGVQQNTTNGYQPNPKLSRTSIDGTPDVNFGISGSVELPGYNSDNSYSGASYNQKIDFYDEDYIFCLAHQFNDASSNHLYSITPDGTLNNEFNAGTGFTSIEYDVPPYYTVPPNIFLFDAIFVNNVFLLAGLYGYELPYPHLRDYKAVMYAVDKSGNIQNINSLPSYEEPDIANGSFIDMIELNGSIYVLGFDYSDEISSYYGSDHEFIVTKYNTSTLGVNDVALENVKIVNPFSDQIIISGLKAFKSIKLYNLAGQLVLTSKSLKINTSHLNAGNYILVIEDLNGKSTTHKLIKK